MSKDASSSSLRFTSRNSIKHTEPNENDLESLSSNFYANFPPPRTPLNSIPDPSQYLEQKANHEIDYEVARPGRSSDAKLEASLAMMMSKRGGNVGNNDNSRVSSKWKSYSEPNSANSTPARRISSVGVNTGSRVSVYGGEKGGSSSKVSKRLSVGNFEVPEEITKFELVEDPSFWNDHNVQTLIRIRPFNNSEKVSQGYGRCLKQESPQSLMWLGHPELRFTFDHIACETISQEKLFKVAGLPMVDNCMSGYNSCMFAYGQTGSGKTYTMIGDIGQMDGKLNEDCGITPRVFEYLFKRIQEEEESRRDERLKYSCKCSFLEIYNEQITDLLDPSSTNLQLREDLKNGVYVENLKEYSVRNVTDVLKLLFQGVANRKMAATNMNSESSRSHSVFTCIIESHWEKDSVTHLRFGRLNLVDLAGSERQKSSGAEGDRLKEAANINKSLSILGLVIMSLVDVAHGKHRHVPYRDSRLTFLLQDSLGGNSKTTIIANVSPSVCSASETLSTLKFAQRAKLIQNNAKVNEDASGDVTALQRQIQQLKGQLSFLMKAGNNSRSLSHSAPSSRPSMGDDFPETEDSAEESDTYHDQSITHDQDRKLKCLEATLKGALRREKFAETEVKRLEAEVAHMNRLAQQREEDAHLTKMMLRDYEEKFKRLELLADGIVSADKYLEGENRSLKEENELLRARSIRNPELTRFALENIRLLEQLRLFQNFYEQGERETLLSEVSQLRNKLLEALETQESYDQSKFLSRRDEQDNNVAKELEGCRDMNTKLIREFEDLQSEVTQYMNQDQAAVHSAEIVPSRSSYGDTSVPSSQEDGIQQNQSDHDMIVPLPLQSSDALKELADAKVLIEALENDQICLIKELEFAQQENHRLMEILSDKDKVERQTTITLDDHHTNRDVINRKVDVLTEGDKRIMTNEFQVKLDMMTKDLEDARLLSSQYLNSNAVDLSRKHEIELICAEAEMEASKTILHLQEEVATLQAELQDIIHSMTEENDILRIKVAEKEDEKQELHAEWKKASLELTNILLEGSKSLKDASFEIEYISSSFPHVNNEIREHVERVVEVCMEKEEKILLLEKSLEDAQKTVLQMEQRLNSLKGAAMVLTEVQQLENCSSIKQMTTTLDEKISIIELFERKLKSKEYQLNEADKCANAALLVVNKLVEHMDFALTDDAKEDSCTSTTSQMIGIKQVLPVENKIQSDSAMLENETVFSVSNAQSYLSSLHSDIHKSTFLYKEVIQEFVMDVQRMKENWMELKENCKSSPQSPKFVNNDEQNILDYDSFEYRVPETSNFLQPAELVIQEKSGCFKSKEIVADREVSQTGSFFKKFEEAHATMQEADVMLNALLRANEDSRQLTGTWRQTGEELMMEKVSLTEEIEQLKSSLHLKDTENEILQDQIHGSFSEIANLITSLEVSILHMQRDTERMCKVVFSDALMIVKEIMRYICISRSSLESICAEAMEREFAYFVLHQCTVGEYLKKFKSSSEDIFPHQNGLQQDLGHFLTCKHLIGESDMTINVVQGDEQDQSAIPSRMEDIKSARSYTDTMYENLELRKELQRKDVLLKGLLFDISLLQESTSTTKDLRVETENLVACLSQNQHKLQMKTSQVEDLLVQNTNLECRLADAETAFYVANSDLELVKGTIDDLSSQNAEFKVLLRDLNLRKSEAEEQLAEQRDVVKTLEKEILLKTSSAEKQLYSSFEDLENYSRMVSGERDQLHEQIVVLQDKLDMVCSLADENEAIAVEARQESEASKMYAEQKEEEVKILEHSVEELEFTINVLEKKVNEMNEEVERHRIMSDSLELETQALRQRLLTVENYAENRESEHFSGERPAGDQLSRSLELHDAHKQIIALENELAEQTKEIKESKEYISELLLHAEAQASQYQQKYKTLEAMVHEVKTDSSNAISASSMVDKTEKGLTKPRGSSSPFRCIGGLVQQMNVEKEKELSAARIRIEELTVLNASRQREVCTLNTRLAAAESMTHDVIRDLLGVKLDMTNYANMMDQYQLQKLVEEAQQQADKFITMDKEIVNLRSKIEELIEERERCILEVNRKEADIFAIQMTIEQIQERDQLLTAQNEMLKADKTNLQKKVAELDDLVKKLCGTQTTHPRHGLMRSSTEFNKMPTDSGRQVDRRSQHHKSENSRTHGKLDGHGTDLKFRKHRV
ncbi:Kinesin motor domain-containing protein [Heracleum sosnowskyi]|uniref:Kinesin motor domain-containing protein n=1 Tax=Heracleum sosnowskyi TaxID=360622 RepID=A0AAD8MWC5_9APIA|nr:Kinesin motor domain-containing protein [Heracleum sosnowskyi]